MLMRSKFLFIIGAAVMAASSQALVWAPGSNAMSTGDDMSTVYTSGSTVQWFGNSTNSLYMSTNGVVSTTAYTDYDPANWATSGQNMFAPFFTDMNSSGGGALWVGDTASELTFTWQDSPPFNGVGTLTAQLGVVRTAQTQQGRNLLAGDVVLSYDSLISENWVPLAIGGTNGAGATYLADGEPTGGLYTSPFAFGSEIPVGSGMLVFRPDGNGGYNFAPVPEPASMAVLGLGALALLRRRRKA